MSLWKSLVTLQKRDTEKSQCLWIIVFLKWETPATKYPIYSITNFMANILADKTSYSDFSFYKKIKKSLLVTLRLVTLHFALQKGHNCRMKKYNFLNINPSYMIVLKFHMLLLYIYHQTVSKQCFLVGESSYQN